MDFYVFPTSSAPCVNPFKFLIPNYFHCEARNEGNNCRQVGYETNVCCQVGQVNGSHMLLDLFKLFRYLKIVIMSYFFTKNLFLFNENL